MENRIELVLTAIIIKDESTGLFTGMLKEIDGVLAQGTSVEEVVSILPRVLRDVLETNREDSEGALKNLNPGLVTERELVFAA